MQGFSFCTLFERKEDKVNKNTRIYNKEILILYLHLLLKRYNGGKIQEKNTIGQNENCRRSFRLRLLR